MYGLKVLERGRLHRHQRDDLKQMVFDHIAQTSGTFVKAATQAINTIVEGWIREHPEQWLWFHRRWRTARPRVRFSGRRGPLKAVD